MDDIFFSALVYRNVDQGLMKTFRFLPESSEFSSCLGIGKASGEGGINVGCFLFGLVEVVIPSKLSIELTEVT